MKSKALAPRQHVLPPTKSSDRIGNWESYQDNMKEYLLVSSFRVIRSSDNMEITKRKTQSTFSKNTVLQGRQSTASLHSFFRRLKCTV